MAQLPNEMILMILNKLDDLNALLECRLVCRRWNALVKLIRIQTLQVGERYPANCVQMNQFSIDSDPALFNTNRVDFLKSNLMKTILSRLKQLCFCVVRITRHPEWSSFQKSLQQLSELEHLEIGNLILNGRRELRLPNLRVLSIHSLENNQIKLDLPKLSKLLISVRFSSRFELQHPTSVTHLAMHDSYFSPYIHEFVHDFRECQYFHFIDWHFRDTPIIFNLLPKIKEIHCYLFMKKDVLNLIKQRNASTKLNIQIYLNGFSANEPDEVEELFDNDGRFLVTTQRIVSNYDRLPRVVQVGIDLDYNELVRHFGSRLPSDLHTKLSNVRKLRIIGNVDDQAGLLRYIGKLWSPKLEIKFTSLNHASYFYENLHLFWNRGVSLGIEEQPGVISSLDFLIKLVNLSEFSINQQIPYELIERLFKQKRGHMELEFLLNDQPIKIVLNNYNCLTGNEYRVQISGQEFTYTNAAFLNGLRQIFDMLPTDLLRNFELSTF